MSVDRARKDAAEAREWAQLLDNQGGIRDPRSAAILTGLADDVDVLVSELEAAQKERDEAKALLQRCGDYFTHLDEFDRRDGKRSPIRDDIAAAVSGVAAPTEKEER